LTSVCAAALPSELVAFSAFHAGSHTLLDSLAVDRSHQGQGPGRAMFRDGAKRIMNAGDTLGIRGLIVHAVSEEAKAFYIALGFDPSPLEPMTLMVTLADLRSAL
jgi:ribosomal protein S18 acetylase RimI-like enzyme